MHQCRCEFETIAVVFFRFVVFIFDDKLVLVFLKTASFPASEFTYVHSRLGDNCHVSSYYFDELILNHQL